MNNVEQLIAGFSTVPGRDRARWLPALRSLDVAAEDKERIIAALEPYGFSREWIAERVAGAATGPVAEVAPTTETSDTIQPIGTLFVGLGELQRATEQIIGALSREAIYKRGPSLVQLYEGKLLPLNATTVCRLASKWLITMREVVTRSGTDLRPADMPASYGTTALHAYELWDGLKELIGIAAVPVMLEDGSINAKPGYDPTTKIFTTDNFPELNIPAQVDLECAKGAYEVLMAPFSEFPFEEPLDKSVLLAYMLTLAERATLPTSPVFGFSAPMPGSGKGKLVETCNLLVFGEKPYGNAKSKNDDEELRKLFTSLLMAGSPSVLLDNFEHVVGGPTFNAFVTMDRWADRVLGGNSVISVANRMAVAITGNNLRFADDFNRRALLCRLDAKSETPHLRNFTIKDIDAYVLKNRTKLLSALYTIMRGHRQAQKKPAFAVLGSFEDWSCRVNGAIAWLGLPDPAERQLTTAKEDPRKEANIALLDALLECFAGEEFTTRDVATKAKEVWNAGGYTALTWALEANGLVERGELSSVRLGHKLANMVGKIVDGKQIAGGGTIHGYRKFKVLTKKVGR